ncbi:cbb3-type cytochrome c oxidase subunit I [Candidatus Saccharibacteria bacterium]|nr:cbb3-type cytochrome c oxidase subunit I [Candidatus Saccharibacteria bacterium]
MKELLLGKLDKNALPHEWFTIGGSVTFILMFLAVVAFITYKKRWRWLWDEWLTSVDPKKIGIMYFIVGGFMLLRGALDAVMIWLQQSLSAGSSHGYLSADHFQQIFTAHGNIMVFFVAMAFIFGLINYIVPLQIGARDLASPFLNTLGFWLFVAGVVMVNMFFFLGGEYAATGWLAVAPLSGTQFSPGVGVDYWLWSLQISGIGTTLGAINFIVTILKMRAPGMSLKKMPLFTWGSLCSMVMAVTVFPLLTATLFLLFLDRHFGSHFFTTDLGGNAMMYTNLVWMWGHPEVYILMLPAFGVYSEIVSTFTRKKIASYASNVIGMIGVSAFALLVWLHHFFTMGSGADINAFFGLMTMVIAVPTTMLFINWLVTMYRSKILFKTPMLWFLGFVGTFSFGGMTGVILAMPPADFQLHNSLFLVAHFHTMTIGGVLFGALAGISYWFPKMTGLRLNERIGRYAYWCWVSGFALAFVPLYILGLMGATRRLDHYESSTGWQPFFIVALLGGILIMVAIVLQVVQVIATIIQRKQLAVSGDPWNGRTLEWSTAPVPPAYNFAVIPEVTGSDAYWDIKQQASKKVVYEDILMPRNTASGIYISAFAFLTGFAFVWHINWLAIVSIIGIIAVIVSRNFDENTEYVLSAKEVEKIETERNKEFASKQHDIKKYEDADMGLIEFIRVVLNWALKTVRLKK